ncbi:MAG: flagellar biosynthesis protein FlhF [Deltaproteobacteria bacterium]|nr:flagellar biosynthesis protein FlhF [Deltaproteobacteria bacterium]
MEHSVIRTFRGANAREALSAARAALGPEAIVLHTREVPGGIFRQAQFEVMAAIDDDKLAATAVPQHVSHDFSRKQEQGEQRTQAPMRTQDSSRAQDRDERQDRPDRGPQTRSNEPLQRNHELAEELRRIVPRETAPSEMTSQVASLRSALAEARELIGSLGQQRSGMPLAAIDDVNTALVERGLSQTQAAQLVKEALASGTPVKPLALLTAVRDLLQHKLRSDKAPWLHGHKRALALVGPTGVGKTTTLAKIAARALMEQGLRVGLVTVDTYRIGASEQLARYGEIMGVPALVARNAAELKTAMQRLDKCELVLIDTAGRSQPEQIARQADLVRSVPGVELHLVLSAAAGARELAAAAERARPLSPERLIITKLDEAIAPASFVGAATQLAVPVSCVCDGQRVPEDIHAVTRGDLVDLVLGSWDHE